jgi:hypothetical protein
MLPCDFAIVERLDVDEVLNAFRRTYERGRHGEPPDPIMYQSMIERDPRWVLAVMPIEFLNFQTEDESSDERIDRAKRYASRTTPFPPGIAFYAGRGRQRRSGKAYVRDGNHRVLAATYRGDCSIEMFMPEDEYNAVVEDARGRGREMRESTDSLADLIRATDLRYQHAPDRLDGLFVREHVPNLDSIDGYFAESETLRGIRAVPMSDFGGPRTVFYAADDFERSERLADAIRSSEEISPLIVGVDAEGPFIIEGAHRYVALWYLKVREFPAVVVVGRE